jgi:hypothetical protein
MLIIAPEAKGAVEPIEASELVKIARGEAMNAVQERAKRKHKVAIMNAVHDLPVLVAATRAFSRTRGSTSSSSPRPAWRR